MKQKKIAILIAVCFLVFIVGCKKNNQPVEDVSSQNSISENTKPSSDILVTESNKNSNEYNIEKIHATLYMSKSDKNYPEAFKEKDVTTPITLLTYPVNIVKDLLVFEDMVQCYDLDLSTKTLDKLTTNDSLMDLLVVAKPEEKESIGGIEDPDIYIESVKPIGMYYMKSHSYLEPGSWYQVGIYQNQADNSFVAQESYNLLSGAGESVLDFSPKLILKLIDSDLNLEKTKAYFISANSPIGGGFLFTDDTKEYFYPFCFYDTVFSYFTDELYSYEELLKIWQTTNKGTMGYISKNLQPIADRNKIAVSMHECLFGMLNPYPDVNRDEWDLQKADFEFAKPEGISWENPEELSPQALCWFFIRNYQELPYIEANTGSDRNTASASDYSDEIIIDFLGKHFDLSEEYLKEIIQTPEFKKAATVSANEFYYPVIEIRKVENQEDGTVKVTYLCYYSDYERKLVSQDGNDVADYEYNYKVFYAYMNDLVYDPTTFSCVFENSNVLGILNEEQENAITNRLNAGK